MENPELANTSTKLEKKKKSKLYSNKKLTSHGGSSDQEAFLDVKPRRSFWRNLFRKSSKKSEIPPEMPDQKSGIVAPRLNAIFEEPKTPDDKEQVTDDIDEIKKTLKTISPSPPSAVLMTGIDLPPVDPELPKDDTILDYLSDTSSSETSQISIEKQQTTESIQPTFIIESVDDLAESKDQKAEENNSLIKEGYSFEYESEESLTNEELSEKTQDKVKFDDKVEQKDADSNIVVKELNPGSETLTTMSSATDKPEVNSPVDIISFEETEEIFKKSEAMATGSDGVGLNDAVQTSMDNKTKIPKKVKKSEERFNGSLASDIMTFIGPSSSPFIKPVAPNFESVTVKSTENFSEHEMCSYEFNELTSSTGNENCTTMTGNKPLLLPTTTRTTTTIDINNENSLDDFFKLIFNQQTTEEDLQQPVVNYAVAYDPVFANFNVQCYQYTHSGENINSRNNSRNSVNVGVGTEIINKTNADEKQKVVRKRKMMNLLHDKNKMAQYLKEIEDEEIKSQNIEQIEIIKTNNNKENCELSTIIPQSDVLTEDKLSLPTDKKEKLDILLKDTEKILKDYTESNVFFAPNILLTSYPDKYLEIYNLIAKNNSKLSDYSNENKNPTPSVHSENSASILTESQSKKFLNIDKEIENIFEELLGNINELKEFCILNGAEFDAKDELDPLITTKNLKTYNFIESILDDILTNVIASPTSNCKEFETISDQSGTISIQSGSGRNLYFIKSEISLEQSLHKTEQFLDALKDEMAEYNPVSFINDTQINKEENSDESGSVLVDNDAIIQTNNIDCSSGQNLQKIEHFLDASKDETVQYNPVPFLYDAQVNKEQNSDKTGSVLFVTSSNDAINESKNIKSSSGLNFNFIKPDNSLGQSSQKTEKFLDALGDEIVEYNPVLYKNDAQVNIEQDSDESESLLFVDNKKAIVESKNFNLKKPDSSLGQSSQKNEQFLDDLKDEIVEYNPEVIINDTHINREQNFEESGSVLVNNNAITETSDLEKDDIFRQLNILLEYTIQNTENILNVLKIGMDECKPEVGNQTEPNPDKNTDMSTAITESDFKIQTIRKTAEDVLCSIEENLILKEVMDKSKKFGPYKDRKPGESLVKVQNNDFRPTNLPEVTDSLQHIFFGQNSGQIQSDFNLVSENSLKPGTSKNLDKKKSLEIKLPSVPSTDLYITGDSIKFESQNALVETLMEKRFSGATGSSIQQEILPELVNFKNKSVSSDFQQQSFKLERKSPDTNINNFENYGDITKSIEENMKIFQEKMNKIKKINAKTIEMLSNSNFSTPEGSLSILSTITENMLNISSKTSKISKEDRYPQFISGSINSLSDTDNKIESTSNKK